MVADSNGFLGFTSACLGAQYGAPFIMVSSPAPTGFASPDTRNLLVQPIAVCLTIVNIGPPPMAGSFSCTLRRSAAFPVCLFKCLLDISHSLLYVAFHLLRNAFELLGLIARQLSNLLLNLTGNILYSAFH